MSEDDVNLVLGTQPLDVDLVSFLADAEAFGRVDAILGEILTDDFSASLPQPGETEPRRYRGMAGVRKLWLDWLSPWASYIVRFERAIDLDGRVLLLFRDEATRSDTDAVIQLSSAAIWTLRDGLIAAADFYPSRELAFEAAGLPPDS